MAHHDFSPSSLEQYRLCRASYFMQQGLPKDDSEAAIEGTLLHNAVATKSVDGLTTEQQVSVIKCLNFAKSLIPPGPHEIYTEIPLEVAIGGKVITYGTADYLIRTSENRLILIDWKFGYAPVNNASKNIQLASYAVGVMQKFGATECECWIYQPRINHNTHHVFRNASSIIDHIWLIIREATDDTFLRFSPGDEACRYCRARLACPAFRRKYMKVSGVRDGFDLSNPDKVSKMYEDTRLIKSFVSDVENALRRIIESTGSCGKYCFQTCDGSRQIKDLNALYSAIKDIVTPGEFNSICSVTLGKLESLYAEKLVIAAKAKGEKLSKAEAVKMLYEVISPLVTRGTPTKTIIEAPF
ncbi:MAG: DUF2800 domain-containing protein [Victivallaceae bacterium]